VTGEDGVPAQPRVLKGTSPLSPDGRLLSPMAEVAQPWEAALPETMGARLRRRVRWGGHF